jgi:arylsulfatase
MVGGVLPAFDDDVWELYDGNNDYSQARNLAADDPAMLAKLQRLWLIEATKFNVLPIDDRGAERLEPTIAGRPTLIRGNTQLFFAGMGRLSENSVVSIKNKSFSVTAEIDVPEAGAEGVIIAQGGRFGGWCVYAKDGTAKFVYNVLGIHEFATEADAPIPAGKHQVRMEFAYDGGGLAKGGDVTLYYDGTAVGTGRVGATQPMIFSADETTDIGYESGTTVTPDYTAHTSRFTGKIHWVQLDVGVDDHDHFIDPEERFRIAMARQ